MRKRTFLAKHFALLLLLQGSLALAQSQPEVTSAPAPVTSARGASAGRGTPATTNGKPGYDTVYVSREMTTYMIFPENVAVMDLGSRNYTGKIESGNMLLLKPMKDGVAPSSLLVRTAGERIYLHYIAYKARPEKIFWDYRTDTLVTLTPAAGNTGEKVSAGQEIFSGQLARLKAGPKRKLARDKANGLQLSVTSVAVDKEATYLLLDLENRTSIPYQLEYVSFAYKERRSRKSQRRIQPEENLVQPLYQQTLPVVSPHGRELMAYALPLHAGTHKGYLEVVIREASGNRLLSGSIPARKIARSQYLDSTRQTAVLQPQAAGAKGTRQSFHSTPVSQSTIISRKDGR